VLGALFIAAGALHFVSPGFYVRIMPPQMLWLIAVLIAVYPANVYMALEPARFGLPAWALYARLPLQFVLIAWAWWSSRDNG
jgi:uncharacterized membrane protein